MKKSRTVQIFRILILIFAVVFSQNIFAQDIVDVESGYGSLNLAIENSTLGSTFRLARDSFYVLDGTLSNNSGATLKIVAAEGSGKKPVIIPGVDAEGGALRAFDLEGGAEFRNIFISGINELGNRTKKNTITSNGDKPRIVIDNCYFDGDVQAFIRINTDSTQLIVTNTTFGNACSTGDPWDGLSIASRGTIQDTLSFVNCTFYIGSNRPFQTYGGYQHNVIFNHCTFYQFGGVGDGGNIEFDRVINGIFTNNVLVDIGIDGNQFPETTPSVGMISVMPLPSENTYATDADRNITISNNVYCWSQAVVDFQTTYSLQPYKFVSDTTDVFAAQYSNIVIENNVETPITFKDPPDIQVFIAFSTDKITGDYGPGGNIKQSDLLDIRQDRNGVASYWDDNGASFGEADNDFDFSYTENTTTYTTDGKQAGDLRWASITGVEETQTLPVTFTLSQNYPNPFNPTTTIEYSLSNNSHVSLEVYNILGSRVVTLVNNNQRVGNYQVKFDASKLSSGIYFYKLTASNKTLTRKMILLK